MKSSLGGAIGLDMTRHSSFGILAVCADVRPLSAFAPWRQAPVCSRAAAAAWTCGGGAADAMMTMDMLMVMAMTLTMMMPVMVPVMPTMMMTTRGW